jgi:hypothetical protein
MLAVFVSFLEPQNRVPAAAPLAGIKKSVFLFEFSQLVRGTVDYLIELRVGVLFNHVVILVNFDFSFSQHEKLDS